MATRRTELWFNTTDATGRDLRKKQVRGAWFIETMTQFGTFVPSEKGYHCSAVRDPAWTVDWAGNAAINLHREGSIELLMLALDFYDHTTDRAEFKKTILPISIAVTDFVASYFDRDAQGQLLVWPTQSLEGYRPGGYPPTRENCVSDDMPWVAGLHAVLPRLIAVSAENSVAVSQVQAWQALLAALPPLPMSLPDSDEHSVGNGHQSYDAVFSAAKRPFPEGAVLGGSEQPFMYPVHPYRLATVVSGGRLLKTGRDTIGFNQTGKSVKFGFGWKQGIMNVALLGLSSLAASAVSERASTPSGAMRFPAYLPSMQDFRPNEDHLSNMRSALQYMIMQHSDMNSSIFLFPTWPCKEWSVEFKLHAPKRTSIEGAYNHTSGTLRLKVNPEYRARDVTVLNCATAKTRFLP